VSCSLVVQGGCAGLGSDHDPLAPGVMRGLMSMSMLFGFF
jgi:hypothetical protein